MTAPQRPDDSLRDPVLDAAWKTHSTELPPARVDAAILAAAHRETKAGPQALGEDDGGTHAQRPARAWWGLAAAATIGVIAFGVIQLAPPLHKPDTMVASDVPPPASPSSSASVPTERARPQMTEAAPAAPSAQAPAPQADASSPRRSATLARGARDSAAGNAQMQGDAAGSASTLEEARRRAAQAGTRQDRSEPAQAAQPSGEPRAAAITPSPEASIPAPRPFPSAPAPVAAGSPPAPAAARAPADAAKAETASGFAPQRSAPPERTAAMAAPERGAISAPPSQRAADAQPLAKMRATPQAWVERIRTLHAQQRLEDAARELNAFRDAYPEADRQLPPALAEWAASVPRPTR